jgi:hypothetical protein
VLSNPLGMHNTKTPRRRVIWRRLPNWKQAIPGGAQKTRLWLLRSQSEGLVRSQGAARARSVVRRHADFSGIGGAARRLPPLWQVQAGTARLSGGQSALHQAVCLRDTRRKTDRENDYCKIGSNRLGFLSKTRRPCYIKERVRSWSKSG